MLSPSLPQLTEKDMRFIPLHVLYHTASPMKELQPFSRLAAFPGELFNSKNPLTQSETTAQLHFCSYPHHLDPQEEQQESS